EALPEHIVVAAEQGVPSVVADDDDRSGAGNVVGRTKGAAEHGRRTEYVKVMARDEGEPEATDLIARADGREPPALRLEAAEVAESRGLTRKFACRRERHRDVVQRAIAHLAVHRDEAILIGDGQSSQEQRVGDGEHRDGEAESEREDQRDGGGERGGTPDRAG